jgi:hypothetical protein
MQLGRTPSKTSDQGWPIGGTLREIGTQAVRFAGWLVLSLVFVALITPLAIVYRLLRRRREAAWRSVHSPHRVDRYFQPW